MKPRVIISSDHLPNHLQNEIESLRRALEKKYGVAAVIVGIMMENLAQLCSLMRQGDLSDAERTTAWERSKDVCADIIRTFGRLLNVEPDVAVAVSGAYRDFTSRVEEELLGAQVLGATESEAVAVIEKAKMH